MGDKELVAKTFDYSLIEDKDDKGKLINLESRIKKKLSDVAGSMLGIGQELATAQEVLSKHKTGTFGKWVGDAFGFTVRTAENYISAFNKFGNSENVFAIQDSVMIALASPSTPSAAVTEVKKLAAKGVNVTARAAKAIIKKHTPPKPPKEEPKPEPTVAEAAQEAVLEEESEEPVELSTEEKMEADNKEIESFCRELLKWFNDHLPDLHWIADSGRGESARAAIRSAGGTLRQAKSVMCPACEGRENGKPCRWCHEMGYLPKTMAPQVEAVK